MQNAEKTYFEINFILVIMKNKIYLFVLVLLTVFNTSYSQVDTNNDGTGVNETHFKPLILKSHQTVAYENAIPSPTSWIGDITSAGNNLWTGSDDGKIYKISPENGNVIKTINTSIKVIDGFTFDGNHLWAAESTASKLIQKIDTADGSVISSFYHNENNYATHGMAFVDNHLWINMFYPGAIDTTVVLDTLGNVVDKYPNFCEFSQGIAFYNEFFWISANGISGNESELIYKYSKDSFDKVDSISVPGGGYPNGLCIHDNFLWLSNADSDSIYKIDISFSPSSISKPKKYESNFVYPNPFKNILTIDTDHLSDNITIELYNLNGTKVVEKTLGGTNQIDLQDIPQGMYLLYIKENSVVKYFDKIIKHP